MIDWFSLFLGAFMLKLGQVVYRIGREHGAISVETDKKNAEYLHTVIRHAPRDPKADISRAVERDSWSN